MELYREKLLTCNFVILCLDNDITRIKSTISAIEACYEHSYNCVIGEDIQDTAFIEVNKRHPVIRGGKSVAEILNLGLNNGGPEWNFIIVAGSWLRPNVDKKYSYFIESEKDILFPVVNRKTNFVDGTINGILIHKNTFLDVGDFSNIDSFESCKLYWATRAIERGCKFKAIVGPKIC